MPVLAHQRGRGKRSSFLYCRLVFLRERVSYVGDLRVLVREEAQGDVTSLRSRARLKRSHRPVFGGAQYSVGHAVGQLQHLGRVAPGGGQLLFRRRACRRGEIFHERGQVGCGGAAPAVDRLHRIAHCGHRQRRVRALAEQAAQQHALRVRGVLVLVEHDHAVAGALRRPHRCVVPRQLCCHGHLLVERDHATAAQLRRQLLHQRQHVHAHFLLGTPIREHLGELHAGTRGHGIGLSFCEEVVRVPAHPLGRSQLVAHRRGQRQQVLHHRGQRRVGAQLRDQPAGVVDHHVGGNGVQLRVGDQPGVRLHRHQKAVFADQLAGVRVVGGHRRRDHLQVVR